MNGSSGPFSNLYLSYFFAEESSDTLKKTMFGNLVSVMGGALNVYIMLVLDMNFISIVSWANYINSWFSYFNSWANYFGEWGDWFSSWF